MKRMLRRSTFILIFTLAFIIGISYFTVELVVNADKWVDQPYNDHITVKGGLQNAGEIFDRSGTSLAKTVDKRRIKLYIIRVKINRGAVFMINAERG